jgi:hypothetical protein
MNPTFRQALVLLALAAGISPAAALASKDSAVKRYSAQELTVGGGSPDAACLVMAVSLTFDADHIYIADAQDCAVKVFTKKGRFKAAVGRKGQGPGEFWFPSGVSVVGGRLFVADKLNHRIQILDTSGRYLRSFGLPFAPDRVFVLSAGRVLVSRNASGRPGPEKLIHLFDESGAPLGEELEARRSGDSVFDAFLNMFVVNTGPEGDFFVIFKSQERSILHYGRAGQLVEKIPVDARYASKALSLPGKRARKMVEALCWDCARDRGRFHLLAPEYTDEKDLGPGDKVHVLGGDGRLEARIDLPFRVSKLAVDGDRIYAVDAAGDLRILRIIR